MLDLEKLHYEYQLEDLTLGQKYDILQCYGYHIDSNANDYDLEAFIGGKDSLEANKFMYDNDLTPYADFYWSSPFGGHVECGDLYDYVQAWYSDDLFFELLEKVGLKEINDYLQDGYIEEYQEEE